MSALMLTAEQINEWIALVLWPMFRIAGLLSIMPALGGSEVPLRARVALGVIITILIVPTLEPVPTVDPLSLDSVMISGQQILIGLAMGLLVQLAFNAVTLAGESIAITMGLGFALMNDPQNGVQVPTVSQFYLILATLLFLAFDGHHSVLLLMASSFEMLPIGQSLGSGAVWTLVTWGGTMFLGALSIALPALSAMLTVNLIMGIITRAAPQLNLFSVGFPITMTVGFVAILLTLPTFQFSFESLFGLVESAIIGVLSD
ncbi:MAG: flagellar biosynthetic protein FliR [Granulosicoccus sp.]|nr:flagellar biosynthetic protein FliR [Granulosicoccus sp.]